MSCPVTETKLLITDLLIHSYQSVIKLLMSFCFLHSFLAVFPGFYNTYTFLFNQEIVIYNSSYKSTCMRIPQIFLLSLGQFIQFPSVCPVQLST